MRVLRQRNAILRQKRSSLTEVQVWDLELVKLGCELTTHRQDYIKKFLIKLKTNLNTLLPLDNIDVAYSQGWDSNKTLAEALQASMVGDMKVGFTRVGPQRADLICTVNDLPIGQTLSRGQQKLFICALILAQGDLIREQLR